MERKTKTTLTLLLLGLFLISICTNATSLSHDTNSYENSNDQGYVPQSGNTLVSISPENQDVTLGFDSTFNIWINVTADEDDPVSGWEIEIFNWTAGKMNVSSIVEGNYLSDAGSTLFEEGIIYNENGNFNDTYCFTLGENSTTNSSMCYIVAIPMNVGTTPLNFTAELSYDGNSVSFTPEYGNISVHPFPPYSASASYYGGTQINLTWSKDTINGTDKVVVYADNSSYPSPNPSKLIYNDTGTSYEDTGLIPGTTRYYTFWSWNETEKMYSELYQQETNTTPAGGVTPFISAESPTNGSTDAQMYPTLSITVSEPQGQNFNITWETNATSWTQYNVSGTNGTYTQTATWANQSDTLYFWTVRVNDTDGNWANETFHFRTDTYTWGDWSEWWWFNYSNDGPSGLVVTGYNETQINITWVNGANGVDAVVIVRNESGYAGYPTSPSNGTEVFNSTGTNFEDTGLSLGTTYYYSVWSWNETNGNYSLEYVTGSSSTQGEITIGGIFPPDDSSENARPPTNISAYVDGTSIDVYIYFYNMTGATDTWTLLNSWSGQSSQWFETTSLSSFGRGTEFLWGNTNYIWTVNATDGSIWENATYNYTTVSTISGESARYDVNNDGSTINVLDLSICWGRRTFDGTWVRDDLYNVNGDTQVNVLDLSTIWGHNTV